MVSAELKPDQSHCRSLTEAHDFMREPQPGYVHMYVQSPTGSQRWDMCYSVKSVTGREPQTEASGGCVPGNRPGRFSQMVRLHLQEERSRFAGGSAKNMSGKRVDGDETAHRTGLNDHAAIAIISAVTNTAFIAIQHHGLAGHGPVCYNAPFVCNPTACPIACPGLAIFIPASRDHRGLAPGPGVATSPRALRRRRRVSPPQYAQATVPLAQNRFLGRAGRTKPTQAATGTSSHARIQICASGR